MVLPEQGYVRENGRQFSAELVEFKLVRVKGVLSRATARFGIVELVGRGDDELSGGRQYAPHFQQKLPPGGQVLDHLKRHHQVEGRIRVRKRYAGSLFEFGSAAGR